ncbi:MAG: 4-hydroxy-tetrahydrodipicolinate synthase [Bacteroidales bacterium]|jgi:4-hydroxy-tetrahydrodipicolinate synthase|nr:4-hydroxy-tetrahydrodipicolinate synthase [Bacteroidales bacterium]
MRKNIFSGTGVALITPFKLDYSIDYQRINDLVERLINNGIGYIVALGTTAETPALTLEERNNVLKTVVNAVKKRIPIVAGIGGNHLKDIEEQLQLFDLSSVAAILSVTPYYNRPSQSGLVAYYKAIADMTDLPLLLYNVPKRTGTNLEAATTLKIADEIPSVIGVKEASGKWEQMMEILRYRRDDFLLISGDDALTLPLLACGADGVISVIANAFPKQFSDMVAFALNGDIKNAQQLNNFLFEIYKNSVEGGSPAGIKCFLAQMGYIDEILRLPLLPVNEQIRNVICSLINGIQ